MNPFTRPSPHWFYRLLQACFVGAALCLLSWLINYSLINALNKLADYALIALVFYVSIQWASAPVSESFMKDNIETFVLPLLLWAGVMLLAPVITIDILWGFDKFSRYGGSIALLAIYLMGCYSLSYYLCPIRHRRASERARECASALP